MTELKYISHCNVMASDKELKGFKLLEKPFNNDNWLKEKQQKVKIDIIYLLEMIKAYKSKELKEMDMILTIENDKPLIIELMTQGFDKHGAIIPKQHINTFVIAPKVESD